MGRQYFGRILNEICDGHYLSGRTPIEFILNQFGVFGHCRYAAEAGATGGGEE
jgi:hypothetical protein